MALSRFFTDLDDLAQIDWSLMQQQYWNDTSQYPDRKRRRQAEFLVYNQVSWAAILGIGVIDSRVQAQVQTILSAHGVTTKVVVRRD